MSNAPEVAAEAIMRVGAIRKGGSSAASKGPKKLSAAVTIADTTAGYEALLEATRDPNVKEVQVNSNAQDLEQVCHHLIQHRSRTIYLVHSRFNTHTHTHMSSPGPCCAQRPQREAEAVGQIAESGGTE